MSADRRVTYHRSMRWFYLVAAPIALLLAAFGQAGPTWINTFIANRSTWLWCLVGVAYHHGWLRGHKPDDPEDAP